ncbi:MAG: hypothetical protein KIT84_31680 [Labilithrix sp.]|nr:hypothetical protein [Labilithrix sp.]MCW5815631.1 hypothetical protein [Labilithrix sp.]
MSSVNEDAKPEDAEAVPSTSTPPPAKSRRRRIAMNAARVGLAVVVGLAIAEVAFRVRDAGAFPHVNVYVPDPELGARLEPGATEKLRFSNNPVTSLRVNSEGYRGGEWPPPAAEELIVVGDSQVLGLGVEEDETFSAVLQSSLGGGAVVRNLGVPTYGPPEYNAVIEEALAKRPAKTVVYVVNLANDMFEAKRRNKDRHAIWDGWAVRKETAPASVIGFPGRSLLYTHSHAFFAWRGWLHRHEPQDNEQGFASEGTWQDIADAAANAETEHARLAAESTRLAQLHEAQVKQAEDRAEVAAKKLDRAVLGEIPYSEINEPNANYDNPNYIPKDALFEAGRLNPGDIVNVSFGESGRDVRVNAEHIRRGAVLRVAFEKKVRAEAEAKKNKEVLEAFDARDREAKRAAEMKVAPPPKAIPYSPLTPALREAKAACDKHGARLFVVALPIDVQVSKEEWTKYGVEPVDMEPTKVLNEDVLVAARAIGADAFDALPPLAAAQPGAFLHGDLHMTPKGHKAVGEALAKALRAPRVAMPGEGLPAFRSWPPRHDEWRPETEIAVRESDPAGCETKKVREWLGIFCRHEPLATGVVVTSGTEVTAGAVPGGSFLVAPVIPGQDLAATFLYEGASRDFTVKVGDAVATADVGFTKPLAARPELATTPAPETNAFCTCFIAENPGKACSDATTVPNADCARTYGTDCKKLLACASGEPAAVPTCAEGFARAGAAQRCRQLCSKDVACKTGRCVEWQGGQVCL